MTKIARLVLALMLLPVMLPLVQAGTTFIGGVFNLAQVGGASITLGSKTSANSLPVVIASDQGAIAVTGTFFQGTQPVSFGQGNIFSVSLSSISSVVAQLGMPHSNNIPTQTAVGCTTSSGQLLAGNPNRVGLECDSDANNTDRVFLNYGTVAAANTMKRLELGASWQPPVVSTVAIQCLSASGTQNIRCIEYSAL